MRGAREMGEVLNEYFASVFTKEDLVHDESGEGVSVMLR